MQQSQGSAEHGVTLETLVLQRDLAVALSTATCLPLTLQAVIEALLRVDGIDCGGVYLVDARDGALDLAAHAGLSDGFLAAASYFPPESPNAAIVGSGAAMYTRYDRLAAATQADDVRRAEALRASAVVPVLHDGRVIACLNLASRTLDEIPAETRALVETLAAGIGGAIARVRAEEALRERGDDLQSLFDSLADFLFVLDDHGFIVEVNRVVLERLGYESDELTGRHVLGVHPEDRREEAEAIIAEMLRGERAFCPVPLITKDGVRIPVETHVRQGTWRGSPALIGTSRDVTERQRADEAIREQAALIGSLLDTIPDLVFLKDAGGRYVACNPPFAEFFGRPKEEVLGKSDRDLHDPETAAEFAARDAEMLADGRPRQYEIWMTYPDGRRALMHVHKTPYLGTEGRPVGVVGVARDITPRKLHEDEMHALTVSLERRVEERTRELTETNRELEERTRELSAANRGLEEFVYSVSHDLRAPLRAVDGFSLAVLEDHGPMLGDDGRSDLRRVRAAAQRMGDLIDALLSLTTVTRARVAREETDLSAIARRVVDDLAGACPERVVDVCIEGGVRVTTDPRLAAVVMENLLGNAWKFTAGKPEARIEFATRCEGGRRVCCVRDNGAGFDAAYVGQLFRPFQRLHSADEFPGTGIGLATVARALDRLGGRYWAEGEPGRGAAVFFTFDE